VIFFLRLFICTIFLTKAGLPTSTPGWKWTLSLRSTS
jgi:hypothetical protein